MNPWDCFAALAMARRGVRRHCEEQDDEAIQSSAHNTDRTKRTGRAFAGCSTTAPVQLHKHFACNVTATHEYTTNEPRRAEIDVIPGPTLLEFGSPWCGYCRRAQPLVDAAFADHAGVRHIKIANGS